MAGHTEEKAVEEEPDSSAGLGDVFHSINIDECNDESSSKHNKWEVSPQNGDIMK